MNTKHYNIILKVIFVALVLISIVMYALDIIYSNKMHQLFLLMNPIYNSKLGYYHALANKFSLTYRISAYVLAFPILYLNAKNKIKGWLYLIITEVVTSAFCYGLDIILKNYYLKPSGALLQFIAILSGTSIFYLLLCVFYMFKNKKEKILHV
jgi:hypothetical protein